MRFFRQHRSIIDDKSRTEGRADIGTDTVVSLLHRSQTHQGLTHAFQVKIIPEDSCGDQRCISWSYPALFRPPLLVSHSEVLPSVRDRSTRILLLPVNVRSLSRFSFEIHYYFLFIITHTS